MKHCPPSESLGPPKLTEKPRRRIPAFHPVPVSKRHDGWTPARQASFIGMLYETRSVVAAAKAVGMGRESAYRLRKRPGAAGFAAAWDAAMGVPREAVALDGAKSTGLPAFYRAQVGRLQVRVRRGTFLGVTEKPDETAFFQHFMQLNRARAALGMRAWRA